ncbi:GAF domain-containing protein [Thermotoga sp. RQ2]|uniref:GAF domain-containing protein n=1 Tax=Thermotoga sp. (strain RQ2) TaxID=126740 RepID=UPI0001600C28|nr:GAF domain-containing protein [Thermotoga sp. RQ2]ACB09767.1 conserved hypothetical protein [Thermotoga sp. RQ2]
MKPRKKSWFVEVLISYGIVFLFDYLYKTDVFKESFLNFYWIPLLIFCVRYDLVVHVFSSILFFTFIVVSKFLSEEGLNFSSDFALANSIMLVISTVLSLINEVRVKNMERLSLELAYRNEDVSRLEEEVRKLKKQINSLDQKLFYESAGISSLLIELREIFTEDFEKFAQRFVEIVSEYFDVKRMYVYRYKDGFLRLAAGIGRPELGFSLKKGVSLVVDKALQEGVGRILDVIDQVKSSNEPWLAVRIGDGENILGVITVEETATDNLELVEEYLTALAAWIHIVMRKLEFEKYEKYRLKDGTFPADFYETEKNRLKVLEAQHGIPFIEVCVRIKREELGKLLKILRRNDLATKMSEDGEYLLLKLLFPLCDEIGFNIIKKRLESEISEVEIVDCESH